MRAKVPGLAARRSIRAHVARISSFHGMSGFQTCCNSPVPHMAAMAARISSGICPLAISAFSHRIWRSPRARPARWCATDVSPRTAPRSRTRQRSRRGPLRGYRDRRAPR